jgi:hypothetical protein
LAIAPRKRFNGSITPQFYITEQESYAMKKLPGTLWLEWFKLLGAEGSKLLTTQFRNSEEQSSMIASG